MQTTQRIKRQSIFQHKTKIHTSYVQHAYGMLKGRSSLAVLQVNKLHLIRKSTKRTTDKKRFEQVQERVSKWLWSLRSC